MHDSQTRFTLLTMWLLTGIHCMLVIDKFHHALSSRGKIHKLIKILYNNIFLMKDIYR